MCGIAGIVFKDPHVPPDPALLRRMCDVLAHRGPDDEGYYIQTGVGLGHRRLSIIDLAGGAQPMGNETGQIQIVFNGEIYNFQNLRADLSATGRHTLRTRSDTETILHLYEEHGDRCVQFLRGMFAFGLWDTTHRRLLLARDRLGKKPIYYYEGAGSLLFASEMKALLQAPEVPREIDPEAIDLFLTYQYIPHPRTIFRHIRKLPPAHTLVWDNGQIRVQRYWDLEFRPNPHLRGPEIQERLKALLEEATRLRMISDVPLGAFLSGGIDSSITVALMARASSTPVRTFSIGFEEQDFSELAFARQVAQRYHTQHQECIVRPDAAEVLPKLAWYYDEPFGDASALPTYYVAQMTAREVKVALSGDGGDENFAGYSRYQRLHVAAMAAGSLGRLLGTARSPYPPSPTPGAPRSHVLARGKRLALALLCHPWHSYIHSVALLDHSIRQFLYRPEFAAQLPHVPAEDFLLETFRRFPGDTRVGEAAAVDLITYLPCAILAKVDIASMANSLEVRSPFLDHAVVEFAATIPTRLKLRGLQSKYILKETFRDLLPSPILRRRKMGFGIPIHRWMAHELHDFLRDHILSDRALARGYFQPESLQAILEEHQAGRADHGYHLWPLLMLELWHRAVADSARTK